MLTRLFVPQVQAVKPLPARVGLSDELIDFSSSEQLSGLFRRLDPQAGTCADPRLRLLPDLHDLEPALPEAVEITADLVVQSQRSARHRHGEVGIGWQRLVSLPQAVELVHQRDGPFAEVLELRLHGVLKAALAIVDQPERRQTEQPENHHRGQGHGAAVNRTAQRRDRRRLNLAKNELEHEDSSRKSAVDQSLLRMHIPPIVGTLPSCGNVPGMLAKNEPPIPRNDCCAEIRLATRGPLNPADSTAGC